MYTTNLDFIRTLFLYLSVLPQIATFCLSFVKGSVWSSLPPINVSSSDQSKPIILMMASMDSASFFRDKSLGADSPLSVRSLLLVHIPSLIFNIECLLAKHALVKCL